MRNQKGIAHLFLIILVALGVGTGAVLIYTSLQNSLSNSNHSGDFKYKNLSDEQKSAYDQAVSDSAAIAAWIEAAQGAEVNSDVLEQMTDEMMERRREEISEKAQAILEKNTCDALMIDIENALKTAEEAWLAADEATGDALWKWAREAFRGFVVDAAMAVGATFIEQDIDFMSMPYEERKVLYAQAREQFYDRALLAQQAQLFGFEDIHTKILSGEFIEPVCVQLWDISTEIEYYHRDALGDQMLNSYTMGATLKDVPIYKYHPKLDYIRSFEETSVEKGYFKPDTNFWCEEPGFCWNMSHVTGDVYFKIRMKYEDNMEDFWEDKLTIKSEIDLWDTDLTMCYPEDGGGCGRDIGWFPYDNTDIEIPTLMLWKREPFIHEVSEDYSDEAFTETVKKRIILTPKSRMKITNLRPD